MITLRLYSLVVTNSSLFVLKDPINNREIMSSTGKLVIAYDELITMPNFYNFCEENKILQKHKCLK